MKTEIPSENPYVESALLKMKERMFDRLSLGAKKRGLGADSDEKIRRLKTKIYSPQVRSLARPCHLPGPLLLLLLHELASCFDRKARGFLWNILVNICLGFKSTIRL
ncbi:hypothetical protein MTR_5g029430 [Medicago truncatula]|uniref:Uncharacterized protein n=1 Tax=Medicago truncatula TaxID=3880 RepID=G7KCD4_MEDTR|nr:hypothetical protein MTR_5g029430 [Medicago truncatula]